MGLRAATQTTQLGRYHIVERLAVGGMADVLIGRTVGIEGFERHVVIKRIRAEQARNTRYVQMFLDEARLAASLHHANIVQVNDIGEEGGEYFFAMEYVHGEDTRKLLERVAGQDERVPMQHVLAIVTAAAAGLHHAHEQIRPDGTSLGIVHRDVSPANILIGFDGGVKVVDFGIAKAAHQSPETHSGALKGKVSYMSPEQCNNQPVDRRSDVFSLGIVLYELCTVRPLFSRENEFLSMSAIVNHDIAPPSSVRADIPVELEQIIMKALAHSPADRYATTDEMRRALETFADHAGVRTSTTALADYMRKLFGDRREPWLELGGDTEMEMEDLQIEGGDEEQPAPARPVAVPSRRKQWVILSAVGVIAISMAAIMGLRSRPSPTPKPTPTATIKATPAAVAPQPPAPAPAPPPAPAVGAAVPVVGPPPEAMPAPVAAPKKPAHHKQPKTEKHWDPSALFPE